MFALNQGEVCTCPSRALIQASIYDQFMADGVERVKAIVQGDPLDTATMIGAQASATTSSRRSCPTSTSASRRAPRCSPAASASELGGDLAGGYYVSRPSSRAQLDADLPGGDLRAGGVGPPFEDDDEAIAIANDTLYGLGAGVWTRDGNTAYRAGRAIQAGRVWTNCYHLYPAHAAFGGYKQSGIGRENHKMMLDHYQQTKNLLVSYSPRTSSASSDTPAAPAALSPAHRRRFPGHAAHRRRGDHDHGRGTPRLTAAAETRPGRR
jgi:aldehyde dehydrogenase